LHAQKIYVMGDVHTQTIDGFWGNIKGGIRGVYHHVSPKYLQKYLDEYTYRYSHRDEAIPMFLSFLSRVKPLGG
jgi:transposase